MEETTGGIHITWQQHVDPGGLLPGWLTKSLLKNLPLKTLEGLHEMVEKPRYSHAELQRVEGGIKVVYPNPFAGKSEK